MSKTIEQNARPVIFGELLYDHYPDGNKLLAGAALNVAWHLQGFGLRPIFVSRIGQDTEGELALTAMIRWGMDTRAVQIDPKHQTGNVLLSQIGNENQFEIRSEQAWDFISSAAVMDWLKHLPCSLIYAGSLAQRNSISRKTLQRIILETELPLFVDINLRQPWNETEIIQQCLESAHWLKVSDEELAELTDKTVQSADELQNAAITLKRKYDISSLYITSGAKGAALINERGMKQLTATSSNVVDTVGAGDAFSAVAILGLHLGWNDFQIIKNANEFAARICEKQGGTPLTQKDYNQFLEQWQSA